MNLIHAFKTLNKSLLITSVFLCFSYQTHAAYTFTNLGALGVGNSYASSINNAGEIVGTSMMKNTPFRDYAVGFLWTSGSGMVDLSAAYSVGYMSPNSINDSGMIAASYISPTTSSVTGVVISKNSPPNEFGALSSNVSFSNAISINNKGVAVGYSLTDSNMLAGVTWSFETGLTPIGDKLGVENYRSVAVSINDNEQIVGHTSNDPSGTNRATIWESGLARDLGTLGGRESYAQSINNVGQIVGYSDTSTFFQHATFWNGDSMIDLGAFYPNLTSQALAINNVGDIVGWSYMPNQAPRAALWRDGQIVNLNSFLDMATINAGWVLTEAVDINDYGSIIGNAYNTQTGLTRAFLLAAPVPEPETYAMLLAGLGLVCSIARLKT